MNEDPGLKEAIQRAFGQETYIDGSLNRSFLAQQIFNDEENLARINALVHPVVINDYNNWVKTQSNKPYTIKEAALLFESGSYKDLDEIILVYAPKTIRINRVLMRDVYRTRSVIERIIEKQMSDNSKKKLSNYIITNDDQNMVIPQVLKIHKKLMAAIK